MIKLTPSSPAGRSFLRSIRDKEKRWAKHEQEKARKRAEHERLRALAEKYGSGHVEEMQRRKQAKMEQATRAYEAKRDAELEEKWNR